MKTFRNSVLHNPIFWSGTLIGCLIAVLTLAGVGVYAQSGGDAGPGEPPPDVPAAGNGPAGDLGGEVPQQGQAGGLPAGTLDSAQNGMFGPAAQAPLAATAVISSAITYQGVLKDGGQPADGSFDFSFRLYDDPLAGSQLDEVLVDGLSVAKGQFTTLLDFGPEAYSNQALWLEIAVRPAGGIAYETLTPRQPLTAAPLALGLPNVTTDPTTGYVSIGGGQRTSDYQFLGINDPIEDWVGMYITGGGPNARPFYGYATDDEGAYEFAWTEYNGVADEWQLHTVEGNVFAVNNFGDVRQTAAADGLVKAAAYLECWPDPVFLTVYDSFNTITGAPVTAAVGPAIGQCYIDFGFDLSNRFFNATAVQTGEARGVTCDVDGGNPNRLRCLRWRLVDAGAEGWGGRIMVTVY